MKKKPKDYTHNGIIIKDSVKEIANIINGLTCKMKKKKFTTVRFGVELPVPESKSLQEKDCKELEILKTMINEEGIKSEYLYIAPGRYTIEITL